MIERFLKRFPVRFLILIPTLAVAILYGLSVLQSDFVSLDDGLLITKNPASQQLSFAALDYAFTHYDPELYIPLTFFSYQIDHAIWGLNPVGFHLTNAILHAASASLLALLVLKLSKSTFTAVLTGLLFALHPLNVEAVAWAAARKDVLSAFLAILSLLLFVRWRETGSSQARTWTMVLYVLALLSKVSVAPLPILFFLYDFHQGASPKKAARDLWVFVVPLVLFIAIAIYGKTAVLESSGPLQTLLLASKSTVFYLWKLFVPTGLTVIYPQMTAVTFTSPEFFVPVIILLALLGVMITLWKRRPLVAGLIFVYFLFLLPNSTNFFKNSMLFFASDRYAYVAGIGVFALIALGLSAVDRWLDRRGSKGLATLFGVMIIAGIGALSVVTLVQAKTWRNSETLYRRTIAIYPKSALAWNNLGDVLMKAGRREEAKAAFDRAIEADPSLMAAHLNRGDWLRAEGRLEESRAELEEAVKIIEVKKVGNLEELGAYYYLGQTLEEMGKIDESIAVFARAVERLPNAAEPHYNLGLMLQKHDRKDLAFTEFTRAVELEPLYIAAWYHLAGLQAEIGLLDEAEQSLLKVIVVDPTYEKAREHLTAIRALKR